MERTEQPTPRRREESRKKGQVARSPEVAGVIGLLGGLIALRVFGPWMLQGFTQLSTTALTQPVPREIAPEALAWQLSGLTLSVMKFLLPLLTCCCVGAVAASLLQTGFVASATPITPDWNRINPFQGFQRLLSLRGLAELVKALLKMTLLAAVAYQYLYSHLQQLGGLSALNGLSAVGTIARFSWELLLRLALALMVAAAVDYLFQRRLFERNLRMTKQEVKEEMRRSEGDPLIKSRLRRLQMEFARGRMVQDVSRATVVLTNPTHLAVALRYEPQEHPAPVVVAKGQRLLAERIKARALEHRVPVVENQPLARALYHGAEVGQPIPVDLYQAVAEIIAFVYRLTGRVRGRGGE